MLKKTISYTDYNGNPREKECYFNLSKAEIAEMQLSTDGGLDQVLNKIIRENDQKKIVEYFKNIILKSFGEKSLDGDRFIKSPELTEAFTQTEAYSELFIELATDAEAGAAFIRGILPKELVPNKNNLTALPGKAPVDVVH